MKIIFLLDQNDSEGKLVENSRALEVTAAQLQLRQTSMDPMKPETWLAYPVGEPSEGKFVPLVQFPIGLVQATASLEPQPVSKPKAKVAKKSPSPSKKSK